MPALLLWGPRDPVFSARYLRDLRERLPHADVHRFEGAGHLVVEDADVAGGVLRWLDAQGSVAPEPARESPSRTGRSARRSSSAPDDEGTALVELAGPRSRRVELGGARGPHRPARPRPRGERCAARRPRRAARAAGGRPHVGALRVPAARRRRRRGRRRPRRPRADPRGARRRADASSSGSSGRSSRRAGCAGRPRWSAPDRCARACGRRSGSARRSTSSPRSGGRRPRTCRGPTPTPTPRCCSPRARPGPAKGVAYTHRRLAAMRDVVGAHVRHRTGQPAGRGVRAVRAAGPRARRHEREPAHGRHLAGHAHRGGAGGGRARDRRRRSCSRRRPRCGPWSAPPTARSGPALAGVRLFLSAGAPVGRELLEAAADLMPGAEAHTPYGMTEALVVADVSLEELRALPPGDGVCVGRPVPGVRGRGQRARRRRRGDRRAGQAPGRHRRGAGLGAARQGAVRRTLAHRAGGRAGRRLAPHRRRRAPRRRRSAVDRGAAGARAGDGRRRPHARRARAAARSPSRRGRRGRGRRRPARCAAGRRRGRSPRCSRTARSSRSPPLAAAVRAALAGTDVAAVLVVEQLPTDVRHNSKIDRARVAAWAAAGAGGGAGAAVTRVLVTGASGMLGRAVAAAAGGGRPRRPHAAAQPVARGRGATTSRAR